MRAKFPPGPGRTSQRTSSLGCPHPCQSTLPAAVSVGERSQVLVIQSGLSYLVPLLIFQKYFISTLNHAYAVEVLSQLLFAVVHSQVV